MEREKTETATDADARLVIRSSLRGGGSVTARANQRPDLTLEERRRARVSCLVLSCLEVEALDLVTRLARIICDSGRLMCLLSDTAQLLSKFLQDINVELLDGIFPIKSGLGQAKSRAK